MSSANGSCDLQVATEGLSRNAQLSTDTALLRNAACVHYGSILLARLLLLQEFVGNRPGSKTRMRKWVIAQRFPAQIFGESRDLFLLLSQDLEAALSHDQIMMACNDVWKTLSPHLSRGPFRSHVRLSVVVDNASQAHHPRDPYVVQAGMDCWTALFPPESRIAFLVIGNAQTRALIPDKVVELATLMDLGQGDAIRFAIRRYLFEV